MDKNSFLYHIKPATLIGDRLLPLNELKGDHPQVFDAAYNKYLGREHLTQFRLPHLDCLWNDVIHLAPIHPRLIRKALEQLDPNPIFDRSWLKIPVEALKGLPAVYFEDKPSKYGGDYNFVATCFRPFEIESYRELMCLPDLTLEYYKSQLLKGRRPLLFNGVRHVLVKGRVSLVGAEVISW